MQGAFQAFAKAFAPSQAREMVAEGNTTPLFLRPKKILLLNYNHTE